MDYVTTADLCKKYKVDKSTIFNWRKEGMPYLKINTRTFRYDPKEVEEWIRNKNTKK